MALQILFVASCKDVVKPLVASQFRELDTDRAIRGGGRPGELDPITHVTLPGESPDPSFLAVSPNGCQLAIGDIGSNSVHIFHADAHWIRTIYLDRQRVGLDLPISGFIDNNQNVTVYDYGTRRVVMQPAKGAPREMLLYPPVDEEVRSQIVRISDSTFAEHWFAGPAATHSRDWSEQYSLLYLRTFNSDKRQGIGKIQHFDGALFSAGLNRGFLRFRSDTLWFARRSDGRLFGFPANPTDALPRILKPDVLFHMRPPLEAVEASGTKSIAVENHLLAFALIKNGGFLLAEVAGYEKPRPHTMTAIGQRLTALDSEGRVVESYVVRNRIDDLAVAGNRVFAIERDTTTGNRSVAVYRILSTELDSISTHCAKD